MGDGDDPCGDAAALGFRPVFFDFTRPFLRQEEHQRALFGDRLGLVDNWLHHINDVRDKHIEALQAIGLSNARVDRLCELNVIEQVANVCQTTIVRDAWERGQDVAVHGWVYGLKDGLLRDLDVTVVEPGEAAAKCRAAAADVNRQS